jgi:thioredoxin reductase (NADPH)
MSQKEFYDLVIVGGGPGGLSAGIYAMRAAMTTVLVEKGIVGGQVVMSDTVENYPGFENITGGELSQKFAQHAQSYGLKMIYQEVTEVVPGLEFHTVKMANGEEFKSYAVILATGGSPRLLNVPGEMEYYGKGVSYCGVCDGFFFRGKTVVVIGGGDTAAEESLYLAKLAQKVYLVHRRDELRAGMILQARVKAECKIEPLWNTICTRINAGDDGVNSVSLKSTTTMKQWNLPTDGAFIFIGFNPNNKLVPRGVKMDADGYVMTDDKCETNVPGLYAIGDLRAKSARQIVVSASDGCVAALAAAHYVETKTSTESCELPSNLLNTE